MTLLFLILTAFLPKGETAIHEFYVGLTEVVYTEESETYQVTMKLFTDDLEKGVYLSSGDSIRLGTRLEHEKADSLVFAYIRDKFQLSDSGKKPFKLEFVGVETEFDVTWVYMESPVMKPSTSLGVYNEVLMEVYSDQTHIVNWIQSGITRTALLQRSKRYTKLEQ